MKTIKRLTLFVALLLTPSVPAYADDDGGGGVSGGIGARAAFGWATRYRAKGTPGDLTAAYRKAFYFGISSHLNLYGLSWGRIGVQPQVLLTRRGTTLKYEGDTIFTDSMDYLDVPLLARVLVPVSGSVSAYAVVGPRIGFLLSAKSTDLNGTVQVLEGFDRVDMGATLGVGAAFAIMPQFLLTLEGRYDQGFTNTDDARSDNPGTRNRAFFFTLGIDMELWHQGTSIHDQAVSP